MPKTCCVYELCISSKAAKIICLRSQCPKLGRPMSYKSGTAASKKITLIKASCGTLTNLTKLNESADRCFAVSSHRSQAEKPFKLSAFSLYFCQRFWKNKKP